ncbi:MAG: branched-chain amino acid ABC transporter permease [Armatimonadetes bacterium]|nr:branched-chain amino acid ABC transporter permease [Armatimonadota bacterium]
MSRSWLVVLASVPILLGLDHLSHSLNPRIQQIVIFIGINIILAVGLNLINGYAGQFSLGHAGFMAIGGYTSAYLTVHYGMLFPLAMVVGGLAAAASGVLVGLPTLRLRGDYLAIATLGFGEIVRVFFLNLDATGGARGLPGIPALTTFFWVYLAALLSVVIVLNLIQSSHGRAVVAVREDELAAEVMGISTTYYKMTAFIVGAFLAGVAGCLFGHYLQILHPNKFNFILSIEVVVMVVLGGMGSTTGAVLAAALLTILPELLREVPAIAEDIAAASPFLGSFLGVFGEPAMRMVLYSLMMILLMIFRPYGLMGNREAFPGLLRRRSNLQRTAPRTEPEVEPLVKTGTEAPEEP